MLALELKKLDTLLYETEKFWKNPTIQFQMHIHSNKAFSSTRENNSDQRALANNPLVNNVGAKIRRAIFHAENKAW